MSYKVLIKCDKIVCVTGAVVNSGTLFFHCLIKDGYTYSSTSMELNRLTRCIEVGGVCFACKEIEDLVNSEIQELKEDSVRVIKIADLKSNIKNSSSAIEIHSSINDFLVKNNTDSVYLSYGENDFTLYINEFGEDVYIVNKIECDQQNFLDTLSEAI